MAKRGRVDAASVKKLTYDLWECLSRVRVEGGSKEDARCLEKYYKKLSALVNASGVEMDDQDVWFSRQVLDAYQDLRPKLRV